MTNQLSPYSVSRAHDNTTVAFTSFLALMTTNRCVFIVSRADDKQSVAFIAVPALMTKHPLRL